MKSLLILLIFGLSIIQVYTQTKFAAIGDYGKGGTAEADVSDMIDTWNVDFIVTMGDNNYNDGSASTIDKNIGKDYNQWIYPYIGSYSPGGSPDNINRFFPSLGNHDYIAANAQPYIDYFTLPNNERWYTFSWGSVDFFVLDSEGGWDSNNLSEQWNWLQNTVTNSSGQWKVVYFHHPPYSSRYNHTRMRLDFKSLNIDLVLSAHDHLYERLEIDGVTYMINGLGGKSIYSTNPPISGSIIQYNADFGAMLVEATGSTLISKFYNRNGDLIDTWTKNNSAAPPELLSAEINTPTEVTLYFSKPLEPQSAQDKTNYNIDNGINVLSAVLNSNNRDVTLTTSEHSPNQQYTVTVSNVTDLAGNLISPNNNSADYQLIIILEPIFPVDLYGTPESEKTVTFNLTLPGNIPDFLTYHLIAFDADHGGNDPPEGHAFINGNGPLELFPGATQANGDGQTNTFAFTLPSSWWVNGVNELRFVRLYSTGYRIDSAFISLDGSTDVQGEDVIPNDFTLNQNYPNPFNPSTSISFSLPVDSKVRLSVYNLLGEMVKEITNEEFSAGTHTFSFNADGLTSGIYFYRMEARTFLATRKMTLLR